RAARRLTPPRKVTAAVAAGAIPPILLRRTVRVSVPATVPAQAGVGAWAAVPPGAQAAVEAKPSVPGVAKVTAPARFGMTAAGEAMVPEKVTHRAPSISSRPTRVAVTQ